MKLFIVGWEENLPNAAFENLLRGEGEKTLNHTINGLVKAVGATRPSFIKAIDTPTAPTGKTVADYTELIKVTA